MKEQIKNKIRERIMKKTKIKIFDFDGTLVDTPLPETGKVEYQEKTGKQWPYEGWWGRHESLDMEVFEMPTVPMVMDAYKEAKADPNNIVVMLTGRMQKLSQDVKNILDAKGLSFDDYLYNRGGETGDAKMKDMDILLKKYPEADEIEMWDDRIAHIPRFEEWGAKKVAEGRLKKFHINLVPTTHHGE
jgi:FMN phosphatase YigB (HAD superfamily)